MPLPEETLLPSESLLPSGWDPAPPTWRAVFLTLGGTPVGEILDMHDRDFKFYLLAPSTIAFTLELLSAQTANLLSHKEGLITLWRGNMLAMTCEITSMELVADDQGNHAMAVVATETMWPRLTHRVIGQGPSGLKGPTTPTDQGTWLMDRLSDLNTFGSTKLQAGTITPSGNITGGVWRYKQFMELMQELSASTAGFDFYQRPRDPDGGGITGVIDIAPIIGTSKPNVIFEYGTGTFNAAGYSYLIHNESIINKAMILPPSFPDNSALKVAVSSDSASQTARGLREEVIPSDVNDYTLRTQVAGLHIQLRKAPREQFMIQPAPADGTKRVPQFLKDFNVGDTIRGRVLDQNVLALDADVRVYGVEVQVNDEGQEKVILTLTPDVPA